MDDIDDYPTTNERGALLAETLVWIANHYAGETDGGAVTHRALFEVCGLPLGEDVFPRLFAPERYRQVAAAFTEILSIGLIHENSGGTEPGTPDGKIANEAWTILMVARQQLGDLDPEQGMLTQVRAMMRGLEHWLEYTPGGLHEAMTDLASMMGVHS